MRKCHYIHDSKSGKVLIPGCWPVVLSGDIRDCSCKTEITTYDQFEKQEYNKVLNEKNEHIKELEQEVKSLRAKLQWKSTHKQQRDEIRKRKI